MSGPFAAAPRDGGSPVAPQPVTVEAPETVLAMDQQRQHVTCAFPDAPTIPPLAPPPPVVRVEPAVASCVKPLPPITTPMKKTYRKVILRPGNEPITVNVTEFLPSSPNSRAGAASEEEALTRRSHQLTAQEPADGTGYGIPTH